MIVWWDWAWQYWLRGLTDKITQHTAALGVPGLLRLPSPSIVETDSKHLMTLDLRMRAS